MSLIKLSKLVLRRSRIIESQFTSLNERLWYAGVFYLFLDFFFIIREYCRTWAPKMIFTRAELQNNQFEAWRWIACLPVPQCSCLLRVCTRTSGTFHLLRCPSYLLHSNLACSCVWRIIGFWGISEYRRKTDETVRMLRRLVWGHLRKRNAAVWQSGKSTKGQQKHEKLDEVMNFDSSLSLDFV